MTVRPRGTREECTEAPRRLVQVLDVVSVSPPYPDRRASVLVRVNLEVRREAAAAGSPASPPPPRQPAGRPLGQL